MAHDQGMARDEDLLREKEALLRDEAGIRDEERMRDEDMRTRDAYPEREDPEREGPDRGAAGRNLTTEDLAGGGQDPGHRAAVYPGEATGGPDQGRPGDRGDHPGDRGDRGTPAADPAAGSADEPEDEPLMAEGRAAEFREQWRGIQAGFVDDPRDSVRAADELVAAVMQSLAGTFADRKERLGHQWQQDGEPATEELRMALRQYRSFFNRLLST
ncbi:hypothetical protein [Streptomyces sp. NPDC089919]|uniref:hypothetical protein n=1 Tax=Streptomyces sp. NPDC089919 TaxID=3155188 RepID=UPI00343F2B5F